MAQRFPDGARVIFLGDSITANGLFITHIYDHYLRAFPDCGIQIYNCGISGGSTTSAREYLDENGLNFQPTHAVIMLGINDVSRGLYTLPDGEPDFIDKKLAERARALENYRAGFRALAGSLAARGIRLTFIAPTGIDETQSPRQLDVVGCDAAMEMIGEWMRRDALEFHADFVNMHATMRLYNSARTMTRPDRVHPTEEGHVLMARIFLAAQGLAEEPALTALETLPSPTDLLEKNAARHVLEQQDRALWNAEWLIFRNHPELKTYDARVDYLREFRKKFEEGSFWLTLCGAYEKNALRHPEILRKLLEQTEACAARVH